MAINKVKDKNTSNKAKKKAVLYKKQLLLSCKKFNKNSFTVCSTHCLSKQIRNSSVEQIDKQMISDATSTVKEQRSKSGRLRNTIFLSINLIILVAIMWYQFSQEGIVSLPDLLTKKITWGWLLLAIGFVILLNILESCKIWILIKFSTKHSRPWLSYKSFAIQRFYDNITPLAIGGQPFQVFYLNKRGISASNATSIPVAKYLYSQIVFIVVDLLLVIFNQAQILDLCSDEHSKIIITLCYIGLALNVVLISSVVFLSVSKRAAPAFVIGILKFCNKLHLVKDYRRTYCKVMHTVREYVDTSRVYMSNIWIVLSETLLSIVCLFVNYSIPFLVYCTFAGTFDVSIWLEMIVMALICDLAAGFVPLPGGSGVAELSFTVLFGSVFNAIDSGWAIPWAILLWRLLTYYWYLIQGILVMFYDYLVGNKKIQPTLDKIKTEDASRNKIKLNSGNKN